MQLTVTLYLGWNIFWALNDSAVFETKANLDITMEWRLMMFDIYFKSQYSKPILLYSQVFFSF
jgi:hypothetical protein